MRLPIISPGNLAHTDHREAVECRCESHCPTAYLPVDLDLGVEREKLALRRDQGRGAVAGIALSGSARNSPNWSRPNVLRAKSLQSCLTLCNSMEPTRLLCPWDPPGKNTGMGCHVLLQGIFPTQGSTLYLLCLRTGRRVLYHRPRVTTNCKSRELKTFTVYSNFMSPAYLITSHRKWR